MPAKSLKCINKYIFYRLTTTTIINQCIRYSSSLPIPGKKQHNLSVAARNNINHTRSSAPPSQAYAPWQQRTVLLQDQSYRLPELITARIESISNAKIETMTTKTRQTNIDYTDDTNDLEIIGDTSYLSSFTPTEYFQIKIKGDANAVDVAMQIYIYYTQNALPITLDNIPQYVLDVISKDCGCFIEKQNDIIYRIYPTTLDKETDKGTMHKIQKQIRSSIHRLDVPETWFHNDYLMRLLFKYLREQSKKHNLSFRSGGYFWFSQTQPMMHHDSTDTEIESDAFDDHDEDDTSRYIWSYQTPQNKEIVNIGKELQTYIDEYTKKWNFMSLSNKNIGMLTAKKKELWNYINKLAQKEYNIRCIMSRDCIAWRFMVPLKNEEETQKRTLFTDTLRDICDHIVNMEINIELTDDDRKQLHQICSGFNLIYLIPHNEAFISYYYNSHYIGQQNKSKNKLIESAIRNIIDPIHIPEQNVMANRAKSDQNIRIENSEKFHVVVRMLKYLSKHRADIKNMNDIKETLEIDPMIYYSIITNDRRIQISIETEQEDTASIDKKMSMIYDYINNVHSVTVPIPVLFMLRGMGLRNILAGGIEAKLNIIMSFPPISQDLFHILKEHKEQKRVLVDKRNQIMAKVYFWCKNKEDEHAHIYDYFDKLVYKSMDSPLPIDLFHKSKDSKQSKMGEVFKYYEDRFNLISFAKHPFAKYLKKLNPKPYHFRYWLFAEREHDSNVDECIKEIQKSINECRFVDLKDMSALVYYLNIVPQLQKKYKLKIHTSLNTEDGKLYCYDYKDKDILESFCGDLEQTMVDIKQNHCIAIAGNQYEDIVLFYIESNFKRIQKVIRPTYDTKTGFLWLNKAKQILHVYCDDDNILKNIQHDVIQNIYENSKIFHWNIDFNMDYDSYLKSDYLQQQLRLIMRQTNTHYAIKSDTVSAKIAITNYDKYELDVCCTKLSRLLSGSTDIQSQQIDDNTYTDKSISPKQHLLPKPIILS